MRGGAAKLNHTVFSSITHDTVLPFATFDVRLVHVALMFICVPVGGFAGFVSASAVVVVGAEGG